MKIQHHTHDSRSARRKRLAEEGAKEKAQRSQEEAEREARREAFVRFCEDSGALFRIRPDSAEAKQRLTALLQAAQHSHHKVEDPYENWRRAGLAAGYYVLGAFPGFWEAMENLKAGRDADIQPLIDYLEADPYFFHSGFLAVDCIRFVKRAALAPHQEAQLRRTVLHVLDKGDRREFRDYCRLARRVDSPDLRDALTERLKSADTGVRRRAQWLLAACEQRNERGSG